MSTSPRDADATVATSVTLTAGGADVSLAQPAPAQDGAQAIPLTSASALTKRDLGLASVPNLRDIGGYRTAGGQWVRTGVAYRSQVLTLTPADLAWVDTLGITGVYDLRTPAEITAAPDVVPAGAAYLHLNVLAKDSPTSPSVTSATQAQQYMAEMQQMFVTSAAARTAFGALLTSIAGSSGAQLYHCTAGKDRTGWATAVILTLLGVPATTVMSDYLLSNDYYHASPALQAQLSALPAAKSAIYRHLLDVKPAYLQAGLDQVSVSYGSMFNYVHQGLGLSDAAIATLRHRLLAGA